MHTSMNRRIDYPYYTQNIKMIAEKKKKKTCNITLEFQILIKQKLLRYIYIYIYKTKVHLVYSSGEIIYNYDIYIVWNKSFYYKRGV